MKTFARLMALVLAVAMVFSLAACDKGPNNPDDPNVGPNENYEPTTIKGKTVKVACWWDPMPKANAQTEEGRLQYYQYTDTMEKYGFTVEEIVVNQPDIKPNFEASLMSGDIWADIIYMRAEQAIKFAKAGNLKDLTNLFPMDSVEYNQSMRDFFTINGKTYAFTYYEDNFDQGIAFNKEVFDRVGLPYPYDLVKNKQWTWDKFVEYVQKATITNTTTGKIDVYGYYAEYGLFAAESFMYTAIGRQIVEEENGKYVSRANDPQVLNFMDKVRSLNTMPGVYRPAGNVASWSDAPVKFKTGKIAMYRWGMSGGTSALKDMEYDWGVVPVPTMNAGEEYKFVNSTQNVQVMPAALDDTYAADVAYVYHQIYKSPYTEDERAAARLASFESQLRDKESAELVMHFTDTAPVVLHTATMLGDDTYWGLIDTPAIKALSGEDTIARAFASFAEAHATIVARANGEVE